MERGVYPGLAKCGITLPMLCKVFIGMLLAVGSAGMGKYSVMYLFCSVNLLSRAQVITFRRAWVLSVTGSFGGGGNCLLRKLMFKNG